MELAVNGGLTRQAPPPPPSEDDDFKKQPTFDWYVKAQDTLYFISEDTSMPLKAFVSHMIEEIGLKPAKVFKLLEALNLLPPKKRAGKISQEISQHYQDRSHRKHAADKLKRKFNAAVVEVYSKSAYLTLSIKEMKSIQNGRRRRNTSTPSRRRKTVSTAPAQAPVSTTPASYYRPPAVQQPTVARAWASHALPPTAHHPPPKSHPPPIQTKHPQPHPPATHQTPAVAVTQVPQPRHPQPLHPQAPRQQHPHPQLPSQVLASQQAGMVARNPNVIAVYHPP
eukprot:210252-Amorphochlora_amoeboformis.AAC.1